MTSQRVMWLRPAVVFLPVASLFWVLGGLGRAQVIAAYPIGASYWVLVGTAIAGLVSGLVVSNRRHLRTIRRCSSPTITWAAWRSILRMTSGVGATAVVFRALQNGIPLLIGTNEARFTYASGTVARLLPFMVLALQVAAFLSIALLTKATGAMRLYAGTVIVLSTVLLSFSGGRRFVLLIPSLIIVTIMQGYRPRLRHVVILFMVFTAFWLVGSRRNAAPGDSASILLERASWNPDSSILSQAPWLAQFYIPIRGAAELTAYLTILRPENSDLHIPIPSLLAADWLPLVSDHTELGEYAITRHLLGGNVLHLGPTATPYLSALAWDAGALGVFFGFLVLGAVLQWLYDRLRHVPSIVNVAAYGYGLTIAYVGLYGTSVTSMFTWWQVALAVSFIWYHNHRLPKDLRNDCPHCNN